MKTFRKSLLVMMALILVIACVFTMSSCKKNKNNGEGDHQHNYATTVTAPTCTEGGFTTYTCSCGDTYPADEVEATGHSMATVPALAASCTTAGYNEHTACTVCGHSDDKVEIPNKHTYVSSITTYPTFDAQGVRHLECSACGHATDETINAISVSAPQAADILAAIIGEAQYTLSMSGDSEIVIVEELSDYTYSTGDKKMFRITLAEATLTGKNDTLYGHVKFEASFFEAELNANTGADDVAFNSALAETAALYIYVNGDSISLEATTNGSTDADIDVSLNEALYEALGDYIGLDEENAALLAYLADELSKIAPLANALYDAIANADTPTVTDDYVASLEALIALIGDDILVENASGANTVYTLDFTALMAIIDEVSGKTVAEYLTEVYGEDVVDQLFDFIKTLPNKTIGEIADAAITFSEEAGVPVADIFTAIEIFVNTAYGAEISIYELIEDSADYTLGELVAPGVDVNDLVDQLSAMLDTFYAYTINELISLALAGDTTSFDAIVDEIESMLEGLNSIITLEITTDANGALISFSVEYDIMTLTYADGELEFYVVSGDDSLTVTINENGITMLGIDGTETAIDAHITVSDSGTGSTLISGNLVSYGDDYFDLDAVLSQGSFTNIELVIRGWDEYYNGYSYVSSFETFVDLDYDGDEITLTIQDVTFIIEESIEAGTNRNVISVQGIVDGDVEMMCRLVYSDNYVYYEIGDGTNTACRVGFEFDPVTYELVWAVYEINSLYTQSGVPVCEDIVEFEYTADDGELYIQISDEEIYASITETANGIIVTFEYDGEDILTIEFALVNGVLTVDAFVGYEGETYLDGAISIGSGMLDVDIDKFVTDIGNISYGVFNPDNGAYEMVTYTTTEYLSADFTLNFSIA